MKIKANKILDPINGPFHRELVRKAPPVHRHMPEEARTYPQVVHREHEVD
jgi:hypothetical protein